MTNKIGEENLAQFASNVVQQQLAKGYTKGYGGFEDSTAGVLFGKAVIKTLSGNWQSALAYVAMAVAVWYNSQSQSVVDTQKD